MVGNLQGQSSIERAAVVKISVVIPALNEERNLPLLHERLTRVLESCTDSHEIIFVDDGSNDGTVAALRTLVQRDWRVRMIALSRNFGHEAAVAAGLDRALGDAVVLMDADLQDPPELIADMVKRWRDGAQVVYAQRRRRKGEPLLRRAAIFIFYRLLGRISNVDIPLDTGNFRLMDRRVADVVRSCRENPRFIRGLVPWAGFRQEAVIFDRDPRHAGTTGYGFWKLVRLALDGICSFSQVPLRMATWLGAGVVALSLVLTLVVIAEKLLFNNSSVPRGFAFLACAVFFMGGVQLIMLGMIAQYIGYIFANVQARPIYVVAEERGFTAPEAPDPGQSPKPEVVVRAGARNGHADAARRQAEPPRG